MDFILRKFEIFILGRSAGFAFVQFERFPDAHRALNSVNMTEIRGRPVAVDYALPKDQYETAMFEEKSAKTSEVQEKPEEKVVKEEIIEEEEKKIKSNRHERKKNSSSSDEENKNSDEETENSDEETEENEKMNEPEIKRRKVSKDVEEGRTLFIR